MSKKFFIAIISFYCLLVSDYCLASLSTLRRMSNDLETWRQSERIKERRVDSLIKVRHAILDSIRNRPISRLDSVYGYKSFRIDSFIVVNKSIFNMKKWKLKDNDIKIGDTIWYDGDFLITAKEYWTRSNINKLRTELNKVIHKDTTIGCHRYSPLNFLHEYYIRAYISNHELEEDIREYKVQRILKKYHVDVENGDEIHLVDLDKDGEKELIFMCPNYEYDKKGMGYGFFTDFTLLCDAKGVYTLPSIFHEAYYDKWFECNTFSQNGFGMIDFEIPTGGVCTHTMSNYYLYRKGKIERYETPGVNFYPDGGWFNPANNGIFIAECVEHNMNYEPNDSTYINNIRKEDLWDETKVSFFGGHRNAVVRYKLREDAKLYLLGDTEVPLSKIKKLKNSDKIIAKLDSTKNTYYRFFYNADGCIYIDIRDLDCDKNGLVKGIYKASAKCEIKDGGIYFTERCVNVFFDGSCEEGIVGGPYDFVTKKEWGGRFKAIFKEFPY